MRKVVIALMLAALPALACAQKVSTLPAATTPLGGNEVMPCVQSGASFGCKASSIGLAGVSLITGDCTATGAGVITCISTNGVPFGTFATQSYASPPAIGGTTANSGRFSSLTDTGITGLNQCLHANSSGVISGTGSDCGSGGGGVTATGSPVSGNLTKWSGSNTITNGDLAGDCTTSGTLSITCLKTNGSNFVASATTDTTNASNITSGTLGAGRMPLGITATPSSGQLLIGNAGGTAYAANSLSGDCTITSAGAITCLKVNGVSFATSATTDTTNASNITSGTLGAARMPLGITATPSAGQLLIGNAGGTAYAANSMTGDCAITSAGAVTCTKTSGTSFGTFATQNYATPPTIGGTTPAPGFFTTLSATGALTTNVTGGGIQCLHASNTGVVTGTGSDCGSGGGAVSSISGDGTLITNSSSSGAVTLTLGNTGLAYGVWGGITGSSAAPAYHSLSSYPGAAFPTLNQSTTGNAATATALAATPSQCSGTQLANGIAASGNANCTATINASEANGAAFPAGAALVGTNGSSQVTAVTLANGLAESSGVLGTTYTIRSVSGTTDTIASTDCAYGVNYTSSSSVAITLPQATGSFAVCTVEIQNTGTGTDTVTPTTSTINGASSLPIPPGRFCSIVAVSGNYLVNGCNAVTPATNLAAGGVGGVTGTTGVGNGGTGIANPTAHNLLIGNGSSTMNQLAPSSTSGEALVSNGSSSDPGYATTLPGVTSVNGTTIAASAGTAPGSTGAFTAGDCLKVGSTSPLEIQDQGAACGSGGSGITQLTGDVTAGPGSGSQAASVVKVNGAAVAASANLLASNSSSQIVSASLTQYDLFSGGASNALNQIAPSSTAGQVLISNGSSSQPGYSASAAGLTSANGTNIPASATLLVSGGALGTPSSGTATNLTGLPVGGIASIGANTVVANATGSSASPTAVAVSSLTMSQLQAATTFTVSGTGCTPSAHTGTAFAGTVTLASGPCTSITVTMNGATGFTATTGYHCNVGDRTTQNAGTWIPMWGESATSTSTATIPIPAAAGVTDVISFQCTPY